MNIYTSLGSGDLFSPWMFEILMQLSFGVYVPQTDLQLLGSGYFSFLALKHGSHLATLYLFLKLCTIVLMDIQFFFFTLFVAISLYICLQISTALSGNRYTGILKVQNFLPRSLLLQFLLTWITTFSIQLQQIIPPWLQVMHGGHSNINL